MAITTKHIKGIEYLYFVERDKEANTNKFTYCGPASSVAAKLKAARLERARLEQVRADLNETLGGLESSIREFEGAIGQAAVEESEGIISMGRHASRTRTCPDAL